MCCVLVHGDAVKSDIVFLLDGTDGTKSGFPEIQRFVKSIVERLPVDENKVRVSVVQYANRPAVNFYLSSHRTKDDVMNAIDLLTHKGGKTLNTGAALQFVRHNIFTSSTGSRTLEGVPQVLVLLTSEQSRDDVNGPAVALKDREILLLGIGVGDASLHELEKIAFQQDFAYKVKDFSELPSLQPQLVGKLHVSKVTKEYPGIPSLIGKKCNLIYGKNAFTGLQYSVQNIAVQTILSVQHPFNVELTLSVLCIARSFATSSRTCICYFQLIVGSSFFDKSSFRQKAP